jgi:hypothetical protein
MEAVMTFADPKRWIVLSLAIFANISVARAQTPNDAVQVIPLVESPGQSFLVFGRPFMNNDLLQMLRSHTSHSDWHTSDNTLVPRTFIYDPLHRRLIGPGVQLGDVNNPANLRLGRAITDGTGALDFSARHPPGTIVGQICSMGWGAKGFTACQAAIQLITFDEKTGGLCLSLETGKDGSTPPYPPAWPNGVPFTFQDLVCHVLLFPDGHLVIGLNTDPNQRPKFSLVVNGDGELNGNVTINGNLTVKGVIRADSFGATPGSKDTK